MPTPGERKALLFLSSVILLGAGARGVAVLHSQSPVDAAARQAIDPQIQAVDSVRQAKTSREKTKRSKKRTSTVHLTEPQTSESKPAPAIIDLDIASEAEIETLRGVGPALAKRIVADRDSLGPFGSVDELQRVRGIAKRLAAKLAPQVTFSLLPRHSRTENDGTSVPPRSRRKYRRGEPH